MDLQALLDKKAELDRQIELRRAEQKREAVERIRELMTLHGLSLTDLTVATRKERGAGSTGVVRKPVAVKYKDGEGNQWTGRGLKPKWLTSALASGKKLEDFAV